MRAKITKISSNENALRTNCISGTLVQDAEVGGVVIMTAEPLAKDAHVRVFNTSPIREIEDLADGAKLIKTMNSTYRLEYLE